METGQLILKARLDSTPLFRVYVNPCNDKEVEENKEREKWLPYQGVSFLMAPKNLEWNIQLIDSSGKDALRKAKEQSFWYQNAIPLSQHQIDEATKKKSGLFKKADPNIERNKLFCELPSPINKEQEIIEAIFKYLQQNKDEVQNRSFASTWINESFGNETKAYVGVDIFKSDPDIELIEYYDICWNDKFDFSKISFLSEHFLSHDAFSNHTRMKLLGLCVYDGKLFFAKQSLNFSPSFIVRPAHTSMESSLVEWGDMSDYLAKVFEFLKEK